MAEQQQPKSSTDLVGTPLSRVDGRAKVTGQAKYAADFTPGNCAHAVAFHSTIATGRVTRLDTSAAEKHPGVLAVVTYDNAPKLHEVSMEHQPGKPGQTFLPMQGADVKYAGQYLGIVIAETFTQAAHAAGLVKVEYDAHPPKTELREALSQAWTPKKVGRGDKPDSHRGDPDGAFGSAEVKVDHEYVTPHEHHNPMEMSATVAAWSDDGKLTLWNSTQWVYGARAVVATWLGVDDERVRVIDPYVGGGFGVKGSIWPHEGLAAVAARYVGRPVKLMLTRQQMFFSVGHRPETIQRVALGAKKDGKLTAVIHECVNQAPSWKDEWVEPATKQTRMLYSCANVRTSQRIAPCDFITPTQMRAPGHATGTFALEVAMDELAYALNMDPLELRRTNYAPEDEDEQKPFSSKALWNCYAQGAERFGWSRRNPQPRSMRDGRYLVGYGMATATYPTNRAESKAKARLLAEGPRAVVTVAGHDLGTGTYTICTQIAAESLGLKPEQIKIELADTNLPEGPVAGGSQTAASVGSAVKMVCQKITTQLFERAAADEKSPLHKKEAKTLGVGDGKVFVKESPHVGEPIAELLKRNGGRALEADVDAKSSENAGPESPEGQGSGGKPKPPAPDEFSKHAWGAQFCEVRIDERLREIRVARFVGAFAAGRILNPKTARSQIMGGIVWGISMALHEEGLLDRRTGKVINDNLADYLIPVNPDVPSIDCFFVEEEDKYCNPLGVKGVGELGITGAAAAVVNAVYHATGRRLREIPVRVEDILLA